MSKKCIGCGATLQYKSKSKDGFIKEEKYKDARYCERCFKIKNYGEYTVITEKIEFNKVISKINSSKALVVFLIDILNLNNDVVDYIKKFDNDVFIILTKRDVIPKSIKDSKIIEYFKNNIYKTDNIMCVSSFKNKNIDTFINYINKTNYKKAFIVGLTNSGKSSFINALMSSVGMKPEITTSVIPNTTINFIEMQIHDFSFVDTPGFITENSIYNFLNFEDVKKITPLKELKVKTYQIKPDECVIVDKLLRIDYLSKNKNSFSFYMNNRLEFNRMKIKTRDDLKILPKKTLHLKGNEDIVINGLGFIRVTKECDITIYTLDEKLVSVRKSMI